MNPLQFVMNSKAVNAIAELKLISCLLLVLSLSLSVQAVKADLVIDTIDPNSIATWASRLKAGHFLAQATMGGTQAEIDDLADRIIEIGEDAAFNEWIDDQFSMPYDSFYNFTKGMVEGDGYTFDTFYGDDSTLRFAVQRYSEIAWWDRAIQAQDQLRQRVAWALIQVFVTSEQFSLGAFANVSYYDMLLRNSFGDYRTLLEEVTYHPAMGFYLSSLKNSKGDESLGVFADENFAREILQLFSMGVYELDMNGDYVFDQSSNTENLALGKSTSQSSVKVDGVSSRAVDGNTSGYWSEGSITHTQNELQPWWEVDLGANQTIGDIKLYNRLGYEARLSDFTIQVINADGSVTFSESVSDHPDPVMTINAGGAIGQVIKIQLNQNGTLSLAEVEVFGGEALRPVENYTNEDIKQFAKVFTGLTYADDDGNVAASFYAAPRNHHHMAIYQDFHDTSEKTLLRGVTLPAGQSGDQDISDALDNIAATPSVPPFMAMRLIQRMTSSNPSPTYIENVSNVWASTSGDMKSVIRAILMDPEARDSFEISTSPYYSTLGSDNVALGQATSQSSEVYGGVSARAVDGNTDGVWAGGSVTHTATESQPWWEVDLGENRSIGLINVFNRTDRHSSRLSNFTVSIMDGNGDVIYSKNIINYPELSVAIDPKGATGQRVRVQLDGDGILSLAEVQIFEALSETDINLAQGRATAQSSEIYGGVSSRSVDGDSNGVWSDGSVTHTANESQPWWEVDLGEDQIVGLINVFNRTDKHPSRLSDFTISVIDSSGSVTYSESVSEYPDPVMTFDASGVAGQKVRIQLNGTGILSLSEVQVFEPTEAVTIHVDVVDPLHGKIKEPILLVTQFLRYFKATSDEHDGYIKMSTSYFDVIAQRPLNAPSVFNHYSADYSPAQGPLSSAANGLVLPEAELLPVSFIPLYEGVYEDAEDAEILQDIKVGMDPAVLTKIMEHRAGSVSVTSMIDELNAYLMHGAMSKTLQDEIASILNEDEGMDYESRYARALAIILSSAEYAVVH